MKNKIKQMKGFTLVELLIVIALIAILSVAVLATINPIEQSNKARDASVQNDAAEVLNAYERYYTSTTHYPWMDVTGSTITSVDMAYFSRSTMVGFGLCGNAGGATEASACSAQNAPGLIISTQELKDSFLTKKYTKLIGEPSYSYQDVLYTVKQSATLGNSIYICYVPKAKANRNATPTSTWKLKALSFSGGSEDVAVPTAMSDATVAQITAATYTNLLTAGGNDTLFRCVPE